uniref:non-specific serine/threonine protein kinase n=1 Tax=Elaeophora elaphi TaxID=1147741 RepID=A0A158Q7D8_9BILA
MAERGGKRLRRSEESLKDVVKKRRYGGSSQDVESGESPQIEQDVEFGGSSQSQHDVGSTQLVEVQQNEPEEAPQGRQDVESRASLEVQQDVESSQVQQEVQLGESSEVQLDVEFAESLEVQQEAESWESPQSQQDVEFEGASQGRQDVESRTSLEVQQDVESDEASQGRPDVESRTSLEVHQDVESEEASQGRQDVESRTSLEVHQDVESGESFEGQADVESGESSLSQQDFEPQESSQVRQVIPEPSWPANKEEYRLEEIIGCGATSTIYRAFCMERGAICAIKRVDMENHNLTQLGKEIADLMACRHPNVVSYYTSFQVGNTMWIVMRLLNCGSLRQIMDRHIRTMGGPYELNKGVLSQSVVATILKEILLALDYIHRSQLIHGDIKVSNVLISSEGNVQLADFGPSIWLKSEEKTKKSVPGTLCYLAPEIAALEIDDFEQIFTCTFAVDIWGLGITALEMVTGYPPYHNKLASVILRLIRDNDPPSLETYELRDFREYGKQYRHFLSLCLKKNEKERWSARKLLTHPFITGKSKNAEFLKNTLLQVFSSTGPSSDEQGPTRQLPPITDADDASAISLLFNKRFINRKKKSVQTLLYPKNLEIEPPDFEWDFDVEELEHRVNRRNETSLQPIIPPSAEITMHVNIIECVENQARSEKILMEEKLCHNCRHSIEDQVFQLVRMRKLDPKYIVIVVANLCKIATAAQRQDLEDKYFAFTIEKRKALVTVLEISINVWRYITDHRIPH